MSDLPSGLSTYAAMAASRLLHDAALSELKFSIQRQSDPMVSEFRDGIATVEGFGDNRPPHSALIRIQVQSGPPVQAVVWDILDNGDVRCLVLAEEARVRAGDPVLDWEDGHKWHELSANVGRSLLGRVINPLGEIVDGGKDLAPDYSSPLERPAPGVLERSAVRRPQLTGIPAVDALYPIARGQRMLIAGDRNTGKTTIAKAAILSACRNNVSLNQSAKFEAHKPDTTYCVYVGIGKRQWEVAQLWDDLKNEEGARCADYTVIVTAAASDPASVIFLAPYVGCTIAEYFRDLGRDALVIYDDLSRHAFAYRHLSLVLKHPPGREAYPGDIFFLHSRLLDRAGQMYCVGNNNGHWPWKVTDVHRSSYSPLRPEVSAASTSTFPCTGGSVTALAIAETQEEEFAAYLPTNLVSITDGQIYLSTDQFNNSVLPAIDSNSVSRIGKKGQHFLIGEFSEDLSRVMEEYREAESKVHLDVPGAKERPEYVRGRTVRKFLFTPTTTGETGTFRPWKYEDLFIVLFYVHLGFLDVISLDKAQDGKLKSAEDLVTIANEARPIIDQTRDLHEDSIKANASERELLFNLFQRLQDSIWPYLGEHQTKYYAAPGDGDWEKWMQSRIDIRNRILLPSHAS